MSKMFFDRLPVKYLEDIKSLDHTSLKKKSDDCKWNEVKELVLMVGPDFGLFYSVSFPVSQLVIIIFRRVKAKVPLFHFYNLIIILVYVSGLCAGQPPLAHGKKKKNFTPLGDQHPLPCEDSNCLLPSVFICVFLKKSSKGCQFTCWNCESSRRLGFTHVQHV